MENKETYALLSNIFVKIKNTKMDKKLSTTAETLLLNPHPTESSQTASKTKNVSLVAVEK